jgi:hypothetical protein
MGFSIPTISQKKQLEMGREDWQNLIKKRLKTD